MVNIWSTEMLLVFQEKLKKKKEKKVPIFSNHSNTPCTIQTHFYSFYFFKKSFLVPTSHEFLSAERDTPLPKISPQLHQQRKTKKPPKTLQIK